MSPFQASQETKRYEAEKMSLRIPCLEYFQYVILMLEVLGTIHDIRSFWITLVSSYIH